MKTHSDQVKTVECSYIDCGKRRVHWERQDIERGQIKMEVPIDHPGPYYCSQTCWAYGEKRNVWTGKKIGE